VCEFERNPSVTLKDIELQIYKKYERIKNDNLTWEYNTLGQPFGVSRATICNECFLCVHKHVYYVKPKKVG
jgi:hypothetical protein